jgi:dolichyl-diphosphooligosaccharide--protein glycosyltransferase
MTLPYSSTGYEEYGTEAGYTNVSVRAETPYRFTVGPVTNETLVTSVWTADANVTEGQVLGEVDEPVEVTLEERVISRPEGANETTSNATDATDANGTTGNASSSLTVPRTGSDATDDLGNPVTPPRTLAAPSARASAVAPGIGG